MSHSTPTLGYAVPPIFYITGRIMARKPASPRRRYVRFTRWRQGAFLPGAGGDGACADGGRGGGGFARASTGCGGLQAGFTRRCRGGGRRPTPSSAQSGRRRNIEPNRSRDRPWRTSPQQALGASGAASRGRLRVMAAGRRWWTAARRHIFLAHLGRRGASPPGPGGGLHAQAAWNRRERLPGRSPRGWTSARERPARGLG